MTKKTHEKSKEFPWIRAAWTAFIGVLCLIYWRTLNAPFIYDDKIEVIGNRTIRSLSEWEALLSYNPSRLLLQLSYAFNLNQNGLDPFGFHVVNLVIHALGIGAALWLLNGLNKWRSDPLPTWVPAFGAGLWGLHPMATEGVSYITGRSESLTALFCMLACGAWIAALNAEKEQQSGWLWRMAGIAACTMAMLSKEVGLMCPFALLSLEAMLSNSWKKIKWRAHFPLLGLLGAGVALRLASIDWEMTLFIPKEVNRSMPVQLTTQAEAWIRYVGLWAFPIQQTIYHHLPDNDPLTLRSGLIILGWVSLVLIAWRATRQSPEARWALVAGALFLIPSSSLAPLKENMAEHRAHQLGFWLIAALIYSRSAFWKHPKSIWIALLIPVLATTTYIRNAAWESEVAIWQDAVKKNPENGEAFYALGDAFRFANPPSRERAEYAFIESVKRSPKNMDAWNNLGLVRAQMGKQQAAEQTFEHTLSIKDGRCGDGGPTPCKCKARNNLGKLNGQQGKFRVAEKHLVSAFGLCPNNVLTHYFLGELYREGPLLNKRKALFHLNAVLRIDPEFSAAETIQDHIDNLTF